MQRGGVTMLITGYNSKPFKENSVLQERVLKPCGSRAKINSNICSQNNSHTHKPNIFYCKKIIIWKGPPDTPCLCEIPEARLGFSNFTLVLTQSFFSQSLLQLLITEYNF